MTTMENRYIVTYTTDQGWTGQRWCDLPETAEQLANHLLGGEIEKGTICNVRISHNNHDIAEFEF